MRTNPITIGRALADRVHRRHPVSAPAGNGERELLAAAPAPRATRLRRLLGSARVTPYQLRRGLLW